MEQKLFHKLLDESFKNKIILSNTSKCGCFFCLAIFHPNEIKEWHEEKSAGGGFTAICPKCGVDAILAESEEIKINIEFLNQMHEKAFDNRLPGIQ